MKKIIIIGSGEQAKIYADYILDHTTFRLVGFIDNRKNSVNYRGISIVGDDASLKMIYSSGVNYACIGVGAIGKLIIRSRIFLYLKSLGFKLPNFVHPSALIGVDVLIGEGNYIAAGVIINSRAVISNNCILNTSSIVEHDCFIGNHVHLAPRTTICGSASINDEVFIGASATVLEGRKICSNVIIGAAALVNKDISLPGVYFGMPAKKIGF